MNILTYWKQIALIGAILSGIAFVAHLERTISDQATQITTLVSENATLSHNVANLKKAIATTNTAIDAISAPAAETKERFTNLASRTTTATTRLAVHQALILEEPVSKECPDAIQYLIDAVQEYPK